MAEILRDQRVNLSPHLAAASPPEGTEAIVLMQGEQLSGFSSTDRHTYVLRQLGNLIEYYVALLASLVTCCVQLHANSKRYFLGAGLCWSGFYLQRAVRCAVVRSRLADPAMRRGLSRSFVCNCLLVAAALVFGFYELRDWLALLVILLASCVANFVCMVAAKNVCYSLMVWTKVTVSLTRLLIVSMVVIRVEARVTSAWGVLLWYNNSDVDHMENRPAWMAIVLESFMSFFAVLLLIYVCRSSTRAEQTSTGETTIV